MSAIHRADSWVYQCSGSQATPWVPRKNACFDYNDAIAALESKKNELRGLEKEVNDLSSVMLKGVGFEYGEDSHEYERRAAFARAIGFAKAASLA
jgi:hypothetical protein